MQLKTTTDYAIRTILYLAQMDRIVPSGEVADKMVIPHKYLINIIGSIRKAGLVETFSGMNGGYRLKRPADEITLFDIINAMEGYEKINKCLENGDNCSRYASDTCPVRNSYLVLQDSFDGYLKSITIKDLCSK